MIAKRAKLKSLGTTFWIQNAWLPIWPRLSPSSKRRVDEVAPIGGWIGLKAGKTT